MQKLKPRLQAIAELVKENAKVADIGTDHGYLPIYMITEGKIDHAILSDIGKGPLDSALRTAQKYNVIDKVSLRLGAGLNKINPEECDTIVIAGMGGETISEILEADKWAGDGKHTLILQPMTMAIELRHYLLNNGYEIEVEQVLREGPKTYVVMIAKGGYQKKEVPMWQCTVSNALLKADDAEHYINLILNREKKALLGLGKGKNTDNMQLDIQKKLVAHLENSIKEVQK